jgi:hypothetical protein
MRRTLVGILIILLLSVSGLAAPEQEKRLRDVCLKTVSFNPSLNEGCGLSYQLTADAADFDLIKKVEEKQERKKGVYQVSWNGRDQDGRIVPDEAYFFCVEAVFKDKSMEVYDPTTFSGGDQFDITEIDYDRNQGFFTYSLSKPSRVLFRLGLKDGPLMATLSGWEAKPAGKNLVYWSGTDGDNQVEIINHPGLIVMATGFELPDCSVLTYGNQQYDYLIYKKKLKTIQKPGREEVFRTVKIAPNYYYSRIEDRVPRFKVEFPQAKPENLIANGELMMRIIIDEDSKPFLLKNRFEVILFLDGKFVYEEEEGYTPFNLTWNSKGIKPGEHFLTVNVTSYLGQVGSRTVKVVVK